MLSREEALLLRGSVELKQPTYKHAIHGLPTTSRQKDLMHTYVSAKAKLWSQPLTHITACSTPWAGTG